MFGKKIKIKLAHPRQLYQHCAEIENQARDMYDALVEQMKEAAGVTEQLKEENQWKWICQMNYMQ